MTRSDDPPDWALPAWDATEPERSAAAPPTGSRATGAPPGTFGPRIYGVSEVTRAVRDALRADERLRDVWVEGEVGRVTVSTAGHAYFTLKDERSQLACVWFRDDRVASPFEVRTGLRVVAHGRVDVFDQQGVYQLYVSAVQPAGFGDLALRYEELKARLAAEGLFEAARKRPLPDRPATIAVVTSPTGAVWHDVRTVLERRWPLATVVLVPCLVQGDEAPGSIVRALARLGRWVERCRADGRPDEAPAVTILARGGGSLEDLWSFNDERVVRAVVGHPVPVVCGVGHEVDVTLADFAADVRAPTPSAAAELVTPDRADVAAFLDGRRRLLDGSAAGRLGGLARDVATERRALERLRPEARLAAARERAGLLLDRATRSLAARVATGRAAEGAAVARLGPLGPLRLDRDRDRLERGAGRLPGLVDARLAASTAALESAGAALGALGPEATLRRGYAIVRRVRDGSIVRAPADAPAGERLALRVARGTIAATADGAPEP